MKIWSRRLAPVSVFISRKTQRLYVRQNFLKVFDVPVTIADSKQVLETSSDPSGDDPSLPVGDPRST